jgi:hypothetical protein
MKLGNRGQSAWFDILIIFLSLMVFTSLMWAYTITAKSPSTHNQMRMQDYTQSMLIRTLYATYKTSDTDKRYDGKSISDFMGMYLSNKDSFTLDKDKQPELLKAALGQIVQSDAFKDRPEGALEWFIFEADKKEFCFHIIYSPNTKEATVNDCPEKVVSNAFTSSIAEINTAKSDGFFGSGYNTKKVKLTIVWAREP